MHQGWNAEISTTCTKWKSGWNYTRNRTCLLMKQPWSLVIIFKEAAKIKVKGVSQWLQVCTALKNTSSVQSPPPPSLFSPTLSFSLSHAPCSVFLFLFSSFKYLEPHFSHQFSPLIPSLKRLRQNKGFLRVCECVCVCVCVCACVWVCVQKGRGETDRDRLTDLGLPCDVALTL